MYMRHRCAYQQCPTPVFSISTTQWFLINLSPIYSASLFIRLSFCNYWETSVVFHESTYIHTFTAYPQIFLSAELLITYHPPDFTHFSFNTCVHFSSLSCIWLPLLIITSFLPWSSLAQVSYRFYPLASLSSRSSI
jgi:hypothetical protein